MPISEKIVDRIRQLDEDEQFKRMLLKILNEEDKGTYRFKAEYEKFINDYIEKKSKDGELK